MNSLSPNPESVTKLPPLEDAVVYGTIGAGAQVISHLLLARSPKLPETWQDLVIRYTAGSGIVALGVLVYGLRHPDASARDATLILGGILVFSGAAVGIAHLVDDAMERAEAQGMDVAYEREDAGHVARTKARSPFPLSFPRRA